MHGYGDRGEMASRREENNINILELLPVKNVILAFTKEKTINAIHIQIDSTTALSYLLKMGGTTDKTLVDLSKDIWKYLILKKITITAEYLPGILNTRADGSLVKARTFRNGSYPQYYSNIFARKW